MGRLARDLIVIEATGKLPTLRHALRILGVEAEVIATLGHLYEGPSALREPGLRRVDGALVEVGRRPARVPVVARVTSQIAAASRVIIATDPDEEGHAIADDVYALCRTHGVKRIFRAVFEELTPAGVGAGLQALRPYDPALARPAIVRRQVDRVIGSVLTDFEGHRPVGRVLSALLGTVAARPLATTVAQAIAPVDGIDWLVSGPDAADLASASVATDMHEVSGAGLSLADVLLRADALGGIRLGDAAKQLQSLYVAGKVGYPRTAGRVLSASASAIAARQAARLGFGRFGRIEVAGERVEVGHAAVSLTAEGWAEAHVLTPAGFSEGVAARLLALIGRADLGTALVRSGRPVEAVAPVEARALMPGAGQWETLPAQHVRSSEAALVGRLVEEQLGRPSTWAGQAERMVAKGWIGADGRLTADGARVLAAAPVAMTTGEACRALEEVMRGSAAQQAVPAAVEDALEWVADRVAGAGDRVRAALDPARPLMPEPAVPIPEEEYDYAWRPTF